MPGQRASTQRATPRPTHGDVTGNAALQLGKEQAEAVRDAQRRMSTASRPAESVVDLTDEAAAVEVEEADVEYLNEAQRRTEELSRSGLAIEALPRDRPRNALRSVSRDGKYDPMELVEIRFRDYFPGVTLGKNPETGELRTFDFEANRPYRVNRWVADHLADKEMLV